MTDFDKHITISASLCGHFALGIVSETYLKDVDFEVNVFSRQKPPTMTKSKHVKFYTTKQNADQKQIYSFISINKFDVIDILCVDISTCFCLAGEVAPWALGGDEAPK